MAVLDIWMIANLMYYRTYFSAIPLSSYMLAGNLVDFLPSVTASLRWCDWLFPISTVVTVFLTFRIGCRQKITFRFSRRTYFVLLISSCVLLSMNLSVRGGFIAIYRALRSSAHQHASGPPLYTLFGTLYFDYADELPELTEEQEREIHTWLSGGPLLVPVPDIECRDNCILILAESLESWVLNLTVENQEITPYLNKLIKEPSTLYAPYVLTQVNGGRSIDAQLLMLAGLLPLQIGAYSCRFPFNTYHTLPKAMKELKGTRNYLITVDKTKTWNQGAVARSFGIDTIISYPDFRMTEIGSVWVIEHFLPNARKRLKKEQFGTPVKTYLFRWSLIPAILPSKCPNRLKPFIFLIEFPKSWQTIWLWRIIPTKLSENSWNI